MGRQVVIQVTKQKVKREPRLLQYLKTFLSLKGYVSFRDAAGWHKIIKPYLTPRGRKEYAEKFGKKAFLWPERLRYPIVDPRTGKVSLKGLIAACFYAYRYGVLERKKGHLKVLKKALRLLRRKFGYGLLVRGYVITVDSKGRLIAISRTLFDLLHKLGSVSKLREKLMMAKKRKTTRKRTKRKGRRKRRKSK